MGATYARSRALPVLAWGGAGGQARHRRNGPRVAMLSRPGETVTAAVRASERSDLEFWAWPPAHAPQRAPTRHAGARHASPKVRVTICGEKAGRPGLRWNGGWLAGPGLGECASRRGLCGPEHVGPCGLSTRSTGGAEGPRWRGGAAAVRGWCTDLAVARGRGAFEIVSAAIWSCEITLALSIETRPWLPG